MTSKTPTAPVISRLLATAGFKRSERQAESAHSLMVMTYGLNRYYSWRCACGDSGRGEAPAGSSKEDIAGRAWHDHDARTLATAKED